MAAAAAKVAAQVAPNIVTGGIVAEAGPRPDFSHWTVEDDILLKNSVEAGAAMEALAKGAVRFSRRFSVKELRERWRALLYDPVIAKEAAARIVEAEATLADSSRAKAPNKLNGVQELVRKRRLNSVRTKYYKMRKRVAANRLDPVRHKEEPETMDRVDQVQGSSSRGEPVEAAGGKEVHSPDQVTREDLALDLEDSTFSHMFSLLAAGGVGAVIGALPAVPSAECSGSSSVAAGGFVMPLGNGHSGSIIPTSRVGSIQHRNGVVDTEAGSQALTATEALTEKFFVRGVNNAQDTTIMANKQDLAVPEQSLYLAVQVTPAICPLPVSHLFGKVEDQTLVPGHTLSGEAVQVHSALCPSESVEIFTKGECCLSNTGALPLDTTWFKSSEPLKTDIYVAGASFCCDDVKGADLMVDQQTGGLCCEVQCETETANSGALQNEGKLRPLESGHCDISEYIDKSLWPCPLDLRQGEHPVRIDAEPYCESGDDSSAFSERHADCEFDDLEPNESSSGMFQRMLDESPPAGATGVFAGTERTLMPFKSLEHSEFTIPVPICVFNTEDTNVPSLDGSLLSTSSQSSLLLSQDGRGSWSEGLTTDASEVSKYAGGNGFQIGGDPSDVCELNQGLLRGVSEGCKMNGRPVPETGRCSVATRSVIPHHVAQFVCEELNPDIDAIWCHDFQAQQDRDEREVLGAEFGVLPPPSLEVEDTYDVDFGTVATQTLSTGLVNSLVAVDGTQNGVVPTAKLPLHSEDDQLVQVVEENGASEHSDFAVHDQHEYNSEDDPDSDLEMARFSDVEAMILDMDLDPGFDDEFSARAESRRNYRRHSRTLIRLEQGATSAIQRSLTLRGAIAILYGYQSRYFITKAEVLLGRGTHDNVVDIDLTQEGRANKVSRRQAYIKLKDDGVFYLKNLGRRGLTVNNNAVQFNQRAILGSNCLIEVGGMRFIFEINHKLVKNRVPKLRPA